MNHEGKLLGIPRADKSPGAVSQRAGPGSGSRGAALGEAAFKNADAAEAGTPDNLLGNWATPTLEHRNFAAARPRADPQMGAADTTEGTVATAPGAGTVSRVARGRQPEE